MKGRWQWFPVGQTHGWIKPSTLLGKKIHFEDTPASHGGAGFWCIEYLAVSNTSIEVLGSKLPTFFGIQCKDYSLGVPIILLVLWIRRLNVWSNINWHPVGFVNENGRVVGYREKTITQALHKHPSPSSFPRLSSQDSFREFELATHLSWFPLATQVGYFPVLFNSAFSPSQPPSLFVDLCVPGSGEGHRANTKANPRQFQGSQAFSAPGARYRLNSTSCWALPHKARSPTTYTKSQRAISWQPNQAKRRWGLSSLSALVGTALISQVPEPGKSAAPISSCSPKSRASTNGQPTQTPPNIDGKTNFKPSFSHYI